jgi:hypothetical protein
MMETKELQRIARRSARKTADKRRTGPSPQSSIHRIAGAATLLSAVPKKYASTLRRAITRMVGKTIEQCVQYLRRTGLFRSVRSDDGENILVNYNKTIYAIAPAIG